MKRITKVKAIKPDINSIKTSVVDFVAYYNLNIPKSFPRASLQSMEKFRATYASLFNGVDDWSIEKHRKKVMDWLSSKG